ncbi:aldehyde dehydrogenase family protein [Mangrovitalea sediminis]|uniref:aldehyde dehydrogenase family protein n=1 Tax=Mangrovitalea sediminis TaxID=1982043 RepID=UPI0018E9C738|nr:aldehyde dehydrogenase family protein [Mangrovitalea sediminis]
MSSTQPKLADWMIELDRDIATLDGAKQAWTRTSIAERMALLSAVRECLYPVISRWAELAAQHKGIPEGSPLAGEEWTSGPYALMSACNALLETFSKLQGKTYIDELPVRDVPGGRIAMRVLPHNLWDRLLMSGVTAEVWMEPGITRDNLKENTASAYDIPEGQRQGKLSLVLGAGNIAAIAPLDCFQKLFTENQVVILKLNPVNEYLREVLQPALKPLIDRNVLRIVTGGAEVGEYLSNHPAIEEIHITGSGITHDAIIWGPGEEGRRNKAAGTPRNNRRITSELGAVCPTIVVPGPWSEADLRFQAEQVATQKLHNSGFNCVACQMLLVPEYWHQTEAFLDQLRGTMATAPDRPLYYPGAKDRIGTYTEKYPKAERLSAPQASADRVIVPLRGQGHDHAHNNEVFAPLMTEMRLPGDTAEAYLRNAIEYCNTHLHGTLGANIVIHPATIKEIGKVRFDELIASLKYGCIAINTWTGVGFLTVQAVWGAYPGHTLDDVQSGIGFVHNTYLFDRPERTVVTAPWRPFPRNLLSGELTLLPKPPWFVTHRRAHIVGELLTRFLYKPGWLKLPRIFINALRG